MKKIFSVLLLCCNLIPAVAQDLVITNARILDGTGTNIDSGTMIVRGGRIVSVTAGAVSAEGLPVIDAKGMTLMPGFIDAHRHIINGDSDQWFLEQSVERMQEFLEAGYTTLMSGGGPVPGIVQLQQKITGGELQGPRIITSGRVDPGNFITEELARAEVGKMAAAGVEIIKARIDESDGNRELLAAIVDEAKKYNLEVMVHAVTVPAMRSAIAAGAGKLVHTTNNSWLTNEEAQMIRDAGIENLTTVGFAVPTFGVFNDDNIPTFRDGSPWPAGILDTGSNAAGEKMVNARTLWDNGVTLGFGTDTGYLPLDGLSHELRALNVMFSPLDIVKLMGPNTAAFIDMSDEIGTLEAGKIADLVLVDGDPLKLIFNLLNVVVVIQAGAVVVDHRDQL
jgi:imidazolonepropionase-like amidohydrolase